MYTQNILVREVSEYVFQLKLKTASVHGKFTDWFVTEMGTQPVWEGGILALRQQIHIPPSSESLIITL